MTAILNGTMKIYERIMKKKDPRVEDWLMMKDPVAIINIFFLYLFVVWAGPIFMRNKRPLELKWILVLYNLGLVCLSVYMFYEYLVTSILSNYSYTCQPVDYSNSKLALRMASVMWWFFFSKVIELLDTVFFILRKKNNQVTFLHVYHHCVMLLFIWCGTRFVPGGQSWFVCMWNSLVHILMYSYYGLAALGPQMQKYLWWKRYLTKIQLIQFLVDVIHTGYNLVIECDYPKGYDLFMLFYGISLIILFGNFYYQTYKSKVKVDKDLKSY